jgi:hypothetical protein
MPDPAAPALPSNPQQPVPPEPSPNLVDLINVLADRMDAIIKVYQTTMAHRQTTQVNEDRFQMKMSWLALSMVAFIVVVAAFLTYRGKIDGSTFTFLPGLIVGYLLTFVRDQITGPD